MHAFHCLFDKLIGYLLQNTALTNVNVQMTDDINTLTAKKKIQLLEKVINIGQNRMGMIDADVFCNKLPPSVKELALRRLKSASVLPANIRSWLEKLFLGGAPPIRAEEKMVFCRAILPYLFVDSMHHPCVWAIVTLLSTLSVIHNYEGGGQRLLQLRALVNICLSILELFVKPSFSTIYFHVVVHSVHSYYTSGPLKSTDTLHPESLYCSTREEATGGNNPVQTMSHRLIIRMSAQLLSFGCEEMGELVTKLEYDDLVTVLDSLSIPHNSVRDITIINYLADCARYDNDLFPQVSYLDLVLNGRLESYLDGRWEIYTTSQYMDIKQCHAVSEEDTHKFYRRVVKNRRFGWDTFFVWREVTWEGVHYKSCPCQPCNLKRENIEKGCMGVVYDCEGWSHLFLIYGYVGVYYKNELYIQALGFQLEKVSATEMCENPFAFSVDLRTLRNNRQPPVLISLHRLVVDTLFIADWGQDVIYIGVSTACLRQWKLIKKIMQTPSEAVHASLLYNL